MGFYWISGKRGRRLGLGCLIAAVVPAPWYPWASLALAGLGLAVGVPLWLGRSWWEVLKAPGLALSRSLSSFHSTPPVKHEEESEGLLKRERSGGRVLQAEDPEALAQDVIGNHAEKSPRRRPVRRVPDAPAKSAVDRPYPFPSRSLNARGREASPEATLRPQNCIRLAVDGVAANAERDKPILHSEQEEVIDLSSILENLEKRYRGKRAAGQTQEPETPSAGQPTETLGIEEVRRRLMATYGRRLSSNQDSSELHGKSSRDADAAGGGRVGTFLRPAISPELSKRAGMLKGDAIRGYRPAKDPGTGCDVSIDAARHGLQEGLSVSKGAASPSPVPPTALTFPEDDLMVRKADADVGPPARTVLRDEMETSKAEEAVSLVQPCKLMVKQGELLCLPLQVPVAPLSLPGPPAVGVAASRPVPGGHLGQQGADTCINPFQAGFHDGSGLPSLSLLQPASDSAVAPMSQDDLIDGGILIEEKLAEFRVKVNVQDAYAGPVITRYEVQPAVGVRGGQVVSLMKDLARALGVAAIRVVETIPGKTCMGLELPNPRRQMIRLSEVLSSEVFQSHPSKLAMALGKDIIGEPVVADLARAPHMLVAGTTGSGKSVGVNAMILSLLYRASPDEVRFVMIDPKMLELSIYDGIPHLLAPVVTDMKLAANALNWCVGEMERRYRLMSGLRVRNLAGYNQKVRDAADTGEPLVDSHSLTLGNPVPLSPLPYIVVVVDELADLMMVTGKKIEELIARLAQKARAAGIHLILATQRPSVDVITGLIKANIPTRIAFQVSSKIDSRTILDQMGAECLLGQGDMLYLPPGTGYLQRVHGAFVADEEVYAVAEHLKQMGEPHYLDGVLGGVVDAEEGGAETERFSEESDPLYDDAVAFVISSRRASISSVQRHLRIGYNRAARFVEQMEASGLVSPMENNGNRTVLVPAPEE